MLDETLLLNISKRNNMYREKWYNLRHFIKCGTLRQSCFFNRGPVSVVLSSNMFIRNNITKYYVALQMAYIDRNIIFKI